MTRSKEITGGEIVLVDKSVAPSSFPSETNARLKEIFYELGLEDRNMPFISGGLAYNLNAFIVVITEIPDINRKDKYRVTAEFVTTEQGIAERRASVLAQNAEREGNQNVRYDVVAFFPERGWDEYYGR